MSYLKVNNIEIPSRYEEPSRNPENIGQSGRSINASYRSNNRIFRDSFEVETTFLKSSQTRSIQGLVDGEGHAFNFDSNVYSAKGLSPNSTSGLSLSSSGWHEKALNVTSTTHYITSYSTYTVLVRRSPDWNHYALRSDGKNFLNGSTTGSINFLSFSEGQLNLSSGEILDDLVILPFELTSNQIQELSSSSLQYSELPRIRISGEITNGVNLTCRGNASNSKFTVFGDSEGFNIDGQLLSLNLTEITT